MLVNDLVAEFAVKLKESRVGDFGVVRRQGALIGVGIFWGIGSVRMIKEHPVFVVPGRMQASFFRFEVMALRSAVTSSLVGMELTV